MAQGEKGLYRNVSVFGPSMVVYTLEYQMNYPSVQGLCVFRAEEVLQSMMSLQDDSEDDTLSLQYGVPTVSLLMKSTRELIKHGKA